LPFLNPGRKPFAFFSPWACPFWWATPSQGQRAARSIHQIFKDVFYIFVAASGEIDDHQIIGIGIFAVILEEIGKGMRGFQRRDNPFEAREFDEGVDRFFVGDCPSESRPFSLSMLKIGLMPG